MKAILLTLMFTYTSALYANYPASSDSDATKEAFSFINEKEQCGLLVVDSAKKPNNKRAIIYKNDKKIMDRILDVYTSSRYRSVSTEIAFTATHPDSQSFLLRESLVKDHTTKNFHQLYHNNSGTYSKACPNMKPMKPKKFMAVWSIIL